MPVDRYTKLVLTVIAVSLLYLCVLMSAPMVSAQGGSQFMALLAPGKPQPVVIVGWGSMSQNGQIALSMTKAQDGTEHTNAILPVGVQQAAEDPIIVALPNTMQSPLPVAITAIRPVLDWEPIRTRVEPSPRTTYPVVP
jgi:hypothetical protein